MPTDTSRYQNASDSLDACSIFLGHPTAPSDTLLGPRDTCPSDTPEGIDTLAQKFLRTIPMPSKKSDAYERHRRDGSPVRSTGGRRSLGRPSWKSCPTVAWGGEATDVFFIKNCLRPSNRLPWGTLWQEMPHFLPRFCLPLLHGSCTF